MNEHNRDQARRVQEAMEALLQAHTECLTSIYSTPRPEYWLGQIKGQALLALVCGLIDRDACEYLYSQGKSNYSKRMATDSLVDSDYELASRYRWLRQRMEESVGGGFEVNDQRLVYEDPEPGREVRLFWYPNTPVGFYESHGRTLDEAVKNAIAGELEGPITQKPNPH